MAAGGWRCISMTEPAWSSPRPWARFFRGAGGYLAGLGPLIGAGRWAYTGGDHVREVGTVSCTPKSLVSTDEQRPAGGDGWPGAGGDHQRAVRRGPPAGPAGQGERRELPRPLERRFLPYQQPSPISPRRSRPWAARWPDCASTGFGHAAGAGVAAAAARCAVDRGRRAGGGGVGGHRHAGPDHGQRARDHGPSTAAVPGAVGGDDVRDDAAICRAGRRALDPFYHWRLGWGLGSPNADERFSDRLLCWSGLRAGRSLSRPGRGRAAAHGVPGGREVAWCGDLHQRRHLPAHPMEGLVPAPLPFADRRSDVLHRLQGPQPRRPRRPASRSDVRGVLLGPG